MIRIYNWFLCVLKQRKKSRDCTRIPRSLDTINDVTRAIRRTSARIRIRHPKRRRTWNRTGYRSYTRVIYLNRVTDPYRIPSRPVPAGRSFFFCFPRFNYAFHSDPIRRRFVRKILWRSTKPLRFIFHVEYGSKRSSGGNAVYFRRANYRLCRPISFYIVSNNGVPADGRYASQSTCLEFETFYYVKS